MLLRVGRLEGGVTAERLGFFAFTFRRAEHGEHREPPSAASHSRKRARLEAAVAWRALCSFGVPGVGIARPAARPFRSRSAKIF